MGNSSSCCKADSYDDVNNVNVEVAESYLEWVKMLETQGQGVPVTICVADGRSLYAKLCATEDSLVVNCVVNDVTHVRRMEYNEITGLLHTGHHLGRVASSAALDANPKVIALHMLTNTCIPFIMESEQEKGFFVVWFDENVKSKRSTK